MAGRKTNTQNDTKTRTTSWRNRHLEKNYIFVFFGNQPPSTFKMNAYIFILMTFIFQNLYLLFLL